MKVKLLYERVPHHYIPDLGKLENPIVRYITVFNTSSDVKYTISDLPKGKYIMCAQIWQDRQVQREECIDFIIERSVNHSEYRGHFIRISKRMKLILELQTGVVVLISVSIAFVITVVFYSVVLALKNKRDHSEDAFLWQNYQM